MVGAIAGLAGPMLGGIGGGGGGSGLPGTSANSSIGPTNVNPTATSGKGDRGTFNNVVTFPGQSSDKWVINEPIGSGALGGISSTMLILGFVAFLGIAVLIKYKG